ncbi:MAG: hypothetical protein R3C99_02440 [Pirellulaceae bacterium]
MLPWHLPYSIFEPDPFPLVTLWAGLIIGVLAPVGVALIIRRDWMWFIANFCILANGAIATAWFSGDRYLDTPKLLEHGAKPHHDWTILLNDHWIWLRWISPVMHFRVSAPTTPETENPQSVDEQSDARKSPVGREFNHSFWGGNCVIAVVIGQRESDIVGKPRDS